MQIFVLLQVVFALIRLMFEMYPSLRSVCISRLGVGHGHIDLDRFFSYFNNLIFGRGDNPGKTALTREV